MRWTSRGSYSPGLTSTCLNSGFACQMKVIVPNIYKQQQIEGGFADRRSRSSA